MTMARIVPLFKNGRPTDETNYRPIAVLPLLSKILERVVLVRQMKFLNLNSPLFTRQYGLVKNSNTTCALFDFIVRVQELLDTNLKTGGLFFDLAKAFDVVNHQFCRQWVLDLVQHLGFVAILGS
jgi:hypothetical protein